MNYFKIFSCCFIAVGANRSTICDVQRQEIDFIPNDLVQVIKKLNKNASISSILEEFGLENEEIINEYLNYLHSKEYGFFCNEEDLELFPPIQEVYKTPSKISNLIVESKSDEILKLEQIISDIQVLGCKDVSLVFYEELEVEIFFKIFKLFYDSRIKSFEITSKFNIKHTNDDFRSFSKKLNQLTRLYFFSAPNDNIFLWDDDILFDRIYSTNNVSSFKSCGIVNEKYFNTNLPKVLEAINHNSCLHKKISIDSEGDIRNCPSMPQSFGNIKDITLEEALSHPDFKKYWNLSKDSIEVCKDCEFRYICTDCRAYTERTHANAEGLDISKPLKCGYNPYTGEWEEWSTNPLKEKAIKHYGMEDLVKKNYP